MQQLNTTQFSLEYIGTHVNMSMGLGRSESNLCFQELFRAKALIQNEQWQGVRFTSKQKLSLESTASTSIHIS